MKVIANDTVTCGKLYELYCKKNVTAKLVVFQLHISVKLYLDRQVSTCVWLCSYHLFLTLLHATIFVVSRPKY